MLCAPERELFSNNLLARIHFIIVMISWTGLAPWKVEFPFPGSLTSTFLVMDVEGVALGHRVPDALRPSERGEPSLAS